MAKINYQNKTDRVTSPLARQFKVVAADMNEIKASVNALYDELANVRARISYTITLADFSGNFYDDTRTVGLTPGRDVVVETNDGSNTILSPGNDASAGYQFNTTTGRFTMPAGNYRITLYKPLQLT